MKGLKRLISVALGVVLGAACLSGCAAKQKYVSVELWHYYTNAIQTEFDKLVTEFNDTVGHEKGIIVKATGYGGVDLLTTAVGDAVEEKRGADPVPDVFMGYADTVLSIDKMKPVVDLGKYFSDAELGEYLPEYIEEGRLGGKELKLFPIAKATETMILNYTYWKEFADDYNAGKSDGEQVKLSDFETQEGIVAQSEKYYEWSKAQATAKNPDDPDPRGKALYARDATDNYMIVGSAALGKEIYTVGSDGRATTVFDKTVIRELWDSYYIPYVKGWFSHKKGYGTDCVKVGETLAALGSTSASGFIPTHLSTSDDQQIPIEIKVLKSPVFEGRPHVYTQQGGGLSIFKGNEDTERAAVEFIRWFNEEKQNATFSAATGYLPVKKAVGNPQTVEKYRTDSTMQSTMDTVKTGCEMIQSADRMYTAKPFLKSNEVRTLFKENFSNLCLNDAEQLNKLSGAKYTAALAEKCSDTYFEAWYSTVKASIDTLVTAANKLLPRT